MASALTMDSSDDDNDIYDDAVSTPAAEQEMQEPAASPENSSLGEESLGQVACADNEQTQVMLDTGQASDVYEVAKFVPKTPPIEDDKLEQNFIYDFAQKIPESPESNPEKILNLVEGNGRSNDDVLTNSLEMGQPQVCQGAPSFNSSELDIESRDLFVYDLATPFPVEGKCPDQDKISQSLANTNDPPPIPVDNFGKGDNSASRTDDCCPGTRSIEEDKKEDSLGFSGSGIYEPVMSPEEKFKTAKMYPSELERKYDDVAGSRKWDTMKRGANLSMKEAKKQGWPPDPADFDISTTGTLLSEVYHEGFSDDERPESIEPDYSMSDSTGSEFEDFDSFPEVEENEENVYERNIKALPPKPADRKRNIFKRGIKKISSKSSRNHEEEQSQCLPVQVNVKKHPPPELPPLPKDLTTQQSKKRHVIQSIIDSERSYIDSLQRIEQVYQTPLLQTFGLDKTIVKDVFLRTTDILSHHSMFQIELAECVKNWDRDEKIGDIFTASFSRAMVIDVYSEYVNKFSIAMEVIRNAQNTKPSLRDFLKKQAGYETPTNKSSSLPSGAKSPVVVVITSSMPAIRKFLLRHNRRNSTIMNKEMSPDRLSIFGLMVKPVQRFPQFIMFMQDLLKYTPSCHHDRCAIQRALTELENVAHRLNESKRESEQYLEAKRLIKKLPKTFPHRPEKLLRQDDFEQLETSVSGQLNTKKRRLFLMDDCLICVKVQPREVNQTVEERYRPKSNWMPPPKLVDLELKDSAITPDMHSIITSSNSRMLIQSKMPVNFNVDPLNLYKDLNQMIHDLTVLGNISALVSTLKREYKLLTEEAIHETVRDLQLMIQVKDQQLQLLNSCTITLHDTAKNIRYTFQTARPEMKQEWCKDFLMAKFALEPVNRPGWMKCEENPDAQPAVFMKTISVDMPRNFTKMRCAVPVFLSATGTVDIGIQHLWVAMTTNTRTQVALVSTQSTKPALVESFKAADEEVVAIEIVEGYATVQNDNAYTEDTVWMSTRNSEMIIYSLYSESGKGTPTIRKPCSQFFCHGIAIVIRSCEDRVFVGLDKGNLLIYQRNQEGVWDITQPQVVVIDTMPIRCLLYLDEDLWLSCRDTVYIFPVEENNYKEKKKLDFNKENVEILEMVRSGVGVWVAYKDCSQICLFHIETKEILQELNVKSAVDRMISSCNEYSFPDKKTDSCCVTALMSSRGFLWIGTSIGIILTVSLPRLRDGVPRVWDRPWVSCHAHNGPVKFLIPIYCDTVNVWNTIDGGQLPGAPTAMSASQQTMQESLKVQVLPKSKEESLPPPNVSSTWKKENPESKPEQYQDVRYVISDTNSNTGSDDAKVKNQLHKELIQVINSGQQLRKSPIRTSVHTLLDKASPAEEVNLYYSDLMVCEEGSDSSQHVGLKQEENDTDKPNKQVVSGVAQKDMEQQKSSLSHSHSVDSSHPVSTSAKNKSKSVMFASQNKVRRQSSSVSLRFPHDAGHGPRVTAIDTLRKRNCNAVMVISGGDGYVNFKTEQKDTRNEEASLMMWMYKF